MTVPLNEVAVLVKSVLIDLRACNFGHGKSSLHACCTHARHHACNLSSSIRRSTYFKNTLKE